MSLTSGEKQGTVVPGFVTDSDGRLIVAGTGGVSLADRDSILATAQGFSGQVFPLGTSSGPVAMAAGGQRASLVGLKAGETITSLYAWCTVVHSSSTLIKLALWSKTGTLLANTGDVLAQFAGLGVKGGALSTAYEVPTTDAYYVGIVTVGGTPPSLLRAASGTTGFDSSGLTASLPSGVANTGKSDIGALTVTASGTVPWFGWA